MLCENCGKHEADTYISRTVNGLHSELHLCRSCAKALAFGGASLLGLGLDLGERAPAVPTRRACPKCGATLEYINSTGMLGCPGCYDYFEKELAPVISRCHGGASHKTVSAPAPAPAPAPETPAPAPTPVPATLADKKRAELKTAIEKEDFELAARLRDEIKAMQEEKK